MSSFRDRVESIKKVNTWKQISELKKMYPDYDFEKAKDSLITTIKENYLHHNENTVVVGVTMDSIRDSLGDVLVGDFNQYLILTENMHIESGIFEGCIKISDYKL